MLTGYGSTSRSKLVTEHEVTLRHEPGHEGKRPNKKAKQICSNNKTRRKSTGLWRCALLQFRHQPPQPLRRCLEAWTVRAEAVEGVDHDREVIGAEGLNGGRVLQLLLDGLHELSLKMGLHVQEGG